LYESKAIFLGCRKSIDTFLGYLSSLAMADPITAATILQQGLIFSGIPWDRQRSEKIKRHRFNQRYGGSPEGAAACFNDLRTTNVAAARINNPNLRWFFVALNWLNECPLEGNGAGLFKGDEKTLRKHKWRYVHAIAALQGQKASGVFCGQYWSSSSPVFSKLVASFFL